MSRVAKKYQGKAIFSFIIYRWHQKSIGILYCTVKYSIGFQDVIVPKVRALFLSYALLFTVSASQVAQVSPSSSPLFTPPILCQKKITLSFFAQLNYLSVIHSLASICISNYKDWPELISDWQRLICQSLSVLHQHCLSVCLSGRVPAADSRDVPDHFRFSIVRPRRCWLSLFDYQAFPDWPSTERPATIRELRTGCTGNDKQLSELFSSQVTFSSNCAIREERETKPQATQLVQTLT